MLLSMDDERRFTFTKEERVTGDRRIETLFARGRSFMAYPFKVIFLENECSFPVSFPVSVLITVPKRRIRSAVKRSRLKRLTREAYRLNRHLFDSSLLRENVRLDIAFVYVKDDNANYPMVEKGVQKALLALGCQLDNKRER